MINTLFNSSILFEGAEGVEPEVEEIEEAVRFQEKYFKSHIERV